MSEFYPVSRIEYPYLGGVGFLSGLPVVLVELQEGAPRTSIDNVVRAVHRKRVGLRERAPKWVAIQGDTRLADNDLALMLRTHVQCPVCIETDGRAPMCDPARSGGRLAMWDHVAVRVKLPVPRIVTERFHSIVVNSPCGLSDLVAFDLFLDKNGYNGPRYLDGPGSPSAACAVGKDWRVTASLIRECADGRWLFSGVED